MAFAPGETAGAVELTLAGLLLLGEQAVIDPTAIFVPADAEGTLRRIEIGSGTRVGAYAVICGGACIGENVQVEEHTTVGKPEKGYAVGHLYPGAGARTQLSPGVVVRAGAIIYAGVQAGANTVIGHHTLLRSFVTVGEDTQLGHTLTVERAARIGDGVRCSPGSHITSSCVLADKVFLRGELLLGPSGGLAAPAGSRRRPGTGPAVHAEPCRNGTAAPGPVARSAFYSSR